MRPGRPPAAATGREKPLADTTPAALTAWRPASTGSDSNWHPAEELEPDSDYHTGVARTVEFSRPGDPHCAVIVRVYTAWHGDEPAEFAVHLTWEHLRGENPRDLGGTVTWSETAAGADRRTHRYAEDADNRARYIAGLLSQAAWRDLGRVAPGLAASILTWNGTPGPQPVPAAA